MSEEKTLEEISAPLPLIPMPLIILHPCREIPPSSGHQCSGAHGAGRPRLHSVPLRARANWIS